MPEKLLELENICKKYSDKLVLEAISLTIVQGQTLAILGKNGSGKSTLLKIIMGLSKATQGSVKQVNGRQLKIGYIPEQFPKNLRFTPNEYLRHMGSIQGLTPSYLRRQIPHLISQFELAEAANRLLRNLSKGMRQKVGIMQAVLHEPDLLVLDEPLSGLDITTQKHLTELLLGFKKRGMAIVFTSHEMDLLQQAADRAIILEDNRIKEDFLLHADQKEYMVVEFRWDKEQTWDLLQGLEGLEEFCDLGNNIWRVRVQPEYCDQLLSRSLAFGASIRRVYEQDRNNWRKKVQAIFKSID